MSYKQQAQKLHNEIVNNIKQFSTELGQNGLEFNSIFQVWVTELFYGDEIRVSYNASGLLNHEWIVCTSEIDEREIHLEELDIFELAHIMDLLVTNQFNILKDHEQ